LAARAQARRGRRNSILVLLAVTAAGVALTGGVASAGNGGASGGGLAAPKPPKLTGASCVESCAALRQVAVNGTVKLTGRRLKYVNKVRFPTDNGSTAVTATPVGSRAVEAKVPKGAKDAKPRAEDEFGQRAKSPVPLDIIPESALPEPGSFRLAEAAVSPQKAFFFGDDQPTLNYIFHGLGPTDVRVDVVSQGDGSVVRSWVLEDVAPNSQQLVSWNGQTDAGKAAKSGAYSFQVGGLGDSLTGTGSTEFGYYDHKFPIRGKHSYGDGIGAPRAGHSHQGQDVFAKCGAPLEAARGGKVQFKGYHGAAGNYLVIDGKKTGRDYVYMHLKNKAEVGQGERVRTGQLIGEVGETGNASGCHLHFELWSPPGWYQGGHFLNPTKKLKRWDKWS
jgi:murein DD-endopeptidase MepM/ murein hydrolase activator NlpD